VTSRSFWLAEKRAEIATLADLPLTNIVPSRRDFTQFVATQKQGIALVPRVQRRNPDTGGAWPALDVAAFARRCDDAEAGALAVRTAAVYGTALADLGVVAAAVTAPVLRDDLCLHRQQIYQARLHGADAVVLAEEVPAAELRELAGVASSMHMATVIEVAGPAALAAGLELATACIGLTCAGRDGRADLERARALAARIPRHRTVLLLAEPPSFDALWGLAGIIDAAVVGDLLLDADDHAAAMAAFLARAG
jgi:indole-3-glycerol phosphate synthase